MDKRKLLVWRGGKRAQSETTSPPIAAHEKASQMKESSIRLQDRGTPKFAAGICQPKHDGRGKGLVAFCIHQKRTISERDWSKVINAKCREGLGAPWGVKMKGNDPGTKKKDRCDRYHD